MIKIIFFDIDGTLLSFGKKELSPKVAYALNELKKNNIKICFASGRGNKSLPKFTNIKADVFSTFNGAYCYDEKNTIYKVPLLKEDVIKIIEVASKMNKGLSINTQESLVADKLDDDLLHYFSFGNEVAEIVKDFNDYLNQDIFKIMLSCSMSIRSKFIEDTKECKIAAWWDKAIDIVNAKSGKGEAVKRILDYYKIDKSESLAFGDGENDVEMFPEVGKAIAMGNASDKVKYLASEVCASVDDDGVYQYLVNNHIIKPIS